MYLTILIGYFAVLMLISHLTGRKATDSEFFTASHSSRWYLVAFGMISASISGVSLVSVPGMVTAGQWTYLQTCIGFFFGYIAVAYILLPLYYRLKLTSIYEYLGTRFGLASQKTGSALFIVAKMVTSATKLYIAALLLQMFVFEEWGVPFWLTTVICIAMIWLYTRRGGIKTLVWTDSLQTLLMVGAIIVLTVTAADDVASHGGIWQTVRSSGTSQIFEWDDWSSPRHFVKQFVSGIFIVIVMTGLDQDMMQKNLTCKNLRESRRNMLSYGAAFVPVNLLLLLLGSLIVISAGRHGAALPGAPDDLLPWYTKCFAPPYASAILVIGIISASFSSADSALTSVTTSLYIDFLKGKGGGRLKRNALHFAVCAVFALLVIAFKYISDKSIIDTIYTIVGYAYGPLLGLFAYGLLTHRRVIDRCVPFIAILSPAACFLTERACAAVGYRFGYELLILNGLITFAALYATSLFAKGKAEAMPATQTDDKQIH